MKVKRKVLETIVRLNQEKPWLSGEQVSAMVEKKTGTKLTRQRVNQIRHEVGEKKLLAAQQNGGAIPGYSGFALVAAFLIALFGSRFEPLLPYLKCILFNLHSARNSCNNGDPLHHVSSGRERKKVYDALRRAGLSYEENVRILLEKAASMGLISYLVDLSLDATHLMYHWKKRLQRVGSALQHLAEQVVPRAEPDDRIRPRIRPLPPRVRFRLKGVCEQQGVRKGKVMLGRVKG